MQRVYDILPNGHWVLCLKGKECKIPESRHGIETEDSLSFPSGMTFKKLDWRKHYGRYPWEPEIESKPGEPGARLWDF